MEPRLKRSFKVLPHFRSSHFPPIVHSHPFAHPFPHFHPLSSCYLAHIDRHTTPHTPSNPRFAVSQTLDIFTLESGTNGPLPQLFYIESKARSGPFVPDSSMNIQHLVNIHMLIFFCLSAHVCVCVHVCVWNVCAKMLFVCTSIGRVCAVVRACPPANKKIRTLTKGGRVDEFLSCLVNHNVL